MISLVQSFDITYLNARISVQSNRFDAKTKKFRDIESRGLFSSQKFSTEDLICNEIANSQELAIAKMKKLTLAPDVHIVSIFMIMHAWTFFIHHCK